MTLKLMNSLVFSAQSMGLLSEAHSEEVDHADPFYAHCKAHSDKALVKHRKRNCNAFRLRMEQRQCEKEERKHEKPTPEQLRIERKLKKHMNKYIANKASKSEPWGNSIKIYNFQFSNKNVNHFSSNPENAPFTDDKCIGVPTTAAQGRYHGHRRRGTRVSGGPDPGSGRRPQKVAHCSRFQCRIYRLLFGQNHAIARH